MRRYNGTPGNRSLWPAQASSRGWLALKHLLGGGVQLLNIDIIWRFYD